MAIFALYHTKTPQNFVSNHASIPQICHLLCFLGGPKWEQLYQFLTSWHFINVKNRNNSHRFRCLLASYLLPPWPPKKGGDLKFGLWPWFRNLIFFYYKSYPCMYNLCPNQVSYGNFSFVKVMWKLNFKNILTPEISLEILV